jgi:hypothetical protein
VTERYEFADILRQRAGQLMPPKGGTAKGANSYPVADVLAARGVSFFFSTGNGGDVADGYAHRAVLRKPFLAGDLATMLTGVHFH